MTPSTGNFSHYFTNHWCICVLLLLLLIGVAFCFIVSHTHHTVTHIFWFEGWSVCGLNGFMANWFEWFDG